VARFVQAEVRAARAKIPAADRSRLRMSMRRQPE
jgi:hypothetical protein